MENLLIREAALRDVAAMAELVTCAWQTAYSGLIDPEYPESLDSPRFRKIFTRMISDGLETFFICESESRIRGFVSGKMVAAGPYDCQVVGLYVDPEFQGGGVGALLLERMKRYFAARQCRQLLLWTLQGARNNAFYRKHGGVELEHRELEIGGKLYPGVGFVFHL